MAFFIVMAVKTLNLTHYFVAKLYLSFSLVQNKFYSFKHSSLTSGMLVKSPVVVLVKPVLLLLRLEWVEKL
jgi:hypothetical protein